MSQEFSEVYLKLEFFLFINIILINVNIKYFPVRE